MGRQYYRQLVVSRKFTSKEITDAVFIYAKYKYPQINSIIDIYDVGRKDYQAAFIRRVTAWFLVNYYAESDFTKIAKLLGKSGKSSVSIYVRDFDSLLAMGDKECYVAMETIRMLLEGCNTPGEEVYLKYIKSGKSVFDYFTKDYKHDT
jgi:hypothetical protein